MKDGHIVTTGTPREVFSQVEPLLELGLEVPVATEVAAHLRAQGVPVPADVLTATELGDALCPYV